MVARALLAAALVALVAGCGSSGNGIPRLDFHYDAKASLGYRDLGRVNARSYPIALDDVSFQSDGRTVDAYLLRPPGTQRRPAVVIVPGAGGDRRQLLPEAAWLAARGIVTLTLTPPSSLVTTQPRTAKGLLAQARDITVADVVAVRRAVDLLSTLPTVDGSRVGYLGWSLGAKTGTFVAAEEPRVKSLVLLSAGADALSAFEKQAPASLRPQVKTVLGSVDPIRYVAWAKPGSLLLEDGTRDQVVPHAALLRIANAAPKGTTVRWFAAPHELNGHAFAVAFAWLAQKLAAGPNVPGAATGPS